MLKENKYVKSKSIRKLGYVSVPPSVKKSILFMICVEMRYKVGERKKLKAERNNMFL